MSDKDKNKGRQQALITKISDEQADRYFRQGVMLLSEAEICHKENTKKRNIGKCPNIGKRLGSENTMHITNRVFELFGKLNEPITFGDVVKILKNMIDDVNSLYMPDRDLRCINVECRDKCSLEDTTIEYNNKLLDDLIQYIIINEVKKIPGFSSLGIVNEK